MYISGMDTSARGVLDKTAQHANFSSYREGKYCVGSDTKNFSTREGKIVWGAQNLSSINHEGETLCHVSLMC